MVSAEVGPVVVGRCLGIRASRRYGNAQFTMHNYELAGMDAAERRPYMYEEGTPRQVIQIHRASAGIADPRPDQGPRLQRERRNAAWSQVWTEKNTQTRCAHSGRSGTFLGDKEAA